ncbi:hypothetical protein ES702_02136 [subsurface metagenome]
MKYEVWIKGQKESTLQILDVPAYRDGSNPTPMKIKGVACKSSHFTWANYKNLRYEKVPPKNAREKALG